MRRTNLLLAGLLLSLVSFGSDTQKDYGDKAEVVGIEGTWLLTEIEGNLQKVNAADSGCLLTFHAGTLTCRFYNTPYGSASYRLDPTCKPPHLDYIHADGTVQRLIYQIDKNTLRIAGILDREQRPKGFNDDTVVVYIYKRAR